MNLLFGIVVDDSVYAEYKDKRYAVKHNGKTDMIPLKTIELVANSKDYAAMPEYQKACREVAQTVKTELQNLYRKKAGRREIMKHDDFTGYIKDLQDVYKTAAQKRENLRTAHEKAVEEWNVANRDSSLSEYARTSAKMKYLEAEETYKDAVKNLQNKTNDDILTIRHEFEKHINSFYAADGEKLDDDTVRLLNSGLVLRKDEVERIVSRYLDNPTMIRLVEDYCSKHKIASDLIITCWFSVKSAGKIERKIFDNLAKLINNVVSGNEIAAKVWGTETGHFDRAYGEAIGGLRQIMVRPGAC